MEASLILEFHLCTQFVKGPIACCSPPAHTYCPHLKNVAKVFTSQPSGAESKWQGPSANERKEGGHMKETLYCALLV